MEYRCLIFVAGHRGLVGSAIVRLLKQRGHTNLITRGRNEVDLLDRAAVLRFFDETRPAYVFAAAARVGGILANQTFPADFIRENLLIQTNLLDAARIAGVKKILMLGSSCIYPKFAPQPIREEYLLTGALEPTNEPYAIAKIAGIVMAQAYRRQYGLNAICLMPTNLYGPGDNFDLQNSHVVPALIRKIHTASTRKEPFVTIWGTGTPRRELLHVDDLADAALYLMSHYESPDLVNIGTGEDISIRDLAALISKIAGYEGELRFDPSKPDGTPRKLLDVSRLTATGWRPSKNLEQGLTETYNWYAAQSSVLG